MVAKSPSQLTIEKNPKIGTKKKCLAKIKSRTAVFGIHPK